jgi:hypothetical protein
MNHGGSRVTSFHPPHCVSRRANPLRKIFLCQVPAPTRKRNRLTESGQAAFNGQWWRGWRFHLRRILWRFKNFSNVYMSAYFS